MKDIDIVGLTFATVVITIIFIILLHFTDAIATAAAENKVYENCQKHGVHIFPDSRIIKCEAK